MIEELIKRHEGLRLKPYRDTVGKLTIGYGRNLDDRGISVEEAEIMLKNDIEATRRELEGILPFWGEIDEVRQAVLIDMCFNLGLVRFLQFKKMLRAIERGDFKEAAFEMRHSKWCTQVKTRCYELARMMETGEPPDWLREEV